MMVMQIKMNLKNSLLQSVNYRVMSEISVSRSIGEYAPLWWCFWGHCGVILYIAVFCAPCEDEVYEGICLVSPWVLRHIRISY